MNEGHKIPEPYAAHIRSAQDELEQLTAQRNKALATVYEIETRIKLLDHHISELLKLQIKEHELPEPIALTPDLRLITVEQKVNGVVHG